MAKWQSNSTEFLSEFGPDCHASDLPSRCYHSADSKILGLHWRSDSDTFDFTSFRDPIGRITKRVILSEVAQLFDPLGFLTPVVTRAKVLLQGLWIDRLGWDDDVSPQTARQWADFRDDLSRLSAISIPRWAGASGHSAVEIHGFSDASQTAMGAVVFLRVASGSDVRVSFVCAKSNVAPLKWLTIPRLELSAAVLLTRLTRWVRAQLDLQSVPVVLWTDSSVTLTWVNSHPSRWKDYVRNRMMLIQEIIPDGRWRLISVRDNPADCASRGIGVEQLVNHGLWWRGPSWLERHSSDWPSVAAAPIIGIHTEEKPGITLIMRNQPGPMPLQSLAARYSSLDKLLRVTAIWQRYIARLRGIDHSSLSNPLNPGDLERALQYWMRATQAAYFASEIQTLSNNGRLASSHPLSRLTAYVDQHGVLRVGGRLKFANIPSDSKHQMILPGHSHLSGLIIQQAHLQTLHGGTQLTLGTVRQRYWIVGGRAPVRSHILKCVVCARHRGIRAQQLMGQLPISRVSPTRAFHNSAVDYAGPVALKSWKGRGHKSYKGWLAVFVCMVTSAVHLEIVSDYTADGFIAAYRRFVARRGICGTLFSDCGTNFIGADQQLRRLFLAGTREAQELSHLLLSDRTQWSFNPPGAPHFAVKWEAAVKSVKFHLRRTIGETILTFEQLSTLIAHIEAVLNSRPLEPLSED